MKMPCLLVVRSIGLVGRDATSGETSARIVSHFVHEVRKVNDSMNGCWDKKDSTSGEEPRVGKNDDSRTGRRQTCPVMVCGTASSLDDLDSKWIECFSAYLEVPRLSKDDLRALLSYLLGLTGAELDQAVAQTQNFVLADYFNLRDLARAEFSSKDAVLGDETSSYLAPPPFLQLAYESCGVHFKGSSNDKRTRPDDTHKLNTTEPLQKPVEIQFESLLKLIAVQNRRHAEMSGAPTVPTTSWDDVGGLFEAKRAIIDTITLPRERPELFRGQFFG